MTRTTDRSRLGEKDQWQGRDCLVERRKPADWRKNQRRGQRHSDRSWQAVNPAYGRAAFNRSSGAELFEELANRWEVETALESVVTRKATHPAYQQIIGMGKPALPLILARLRQRPGQWFWALTAISGQDPAHDEITVAGARDVWLRWGAERGLID